MKGEKIYSKAISISDQIYATPELLGYEREVAYRKYLKLIRKAAYLGHNKAQWKLGQHYEDFNCLGFDNPEYSSKRLVYWYTKSCDQNNSDACNNLAHMYQKGEGCERNIKKALELYKKAAGLGNDLGKKNYKLLLKQIKAGKYKLENSGYHIPYNTKGTKIYSHAISILNQIQGKPKLRINEKKVAYEKFLKLIRKAAYFGHEKAQFELGLHYDSFNRLYKKNPEYVPKKCVYWYEKSCDQNCGGACNNLGVCYENGAGCEQNIRKALELYTKAAELGNCSAKKNYKSILKDIKQGKYKLENDSEIEK